MGKYLEIVNCDMIEGRALLGDMYLHFENIQDRDAFNCMKEWHETLKECIDIKEFVVAVTERDDPPRINYLLHVGGSRT